MRFFKNRKISVSVGDLPRNRDDTFKESLAYFGSSRDVVHTNIYNREKILLNKFAKGELRCSTEELDVKLNKEVINDTAVRKYEIDDTSFALAEAVWFPRLKTKRVMRRDGEVGAGLNSRSSSEEELYDGFSGPWSWETSSLQEMGFPPTPELEPKNNIPNTKKNKRKKKLTVTGDEEVDDIRTFETLDELRARLKANYIEAKEQREKYLNLKQEQSDEERRVKSVRGNRGKLKQQDKNDKHAKNGSKGGIVSSFRAKKDQARPLVAKREASSKHQTFESELADAVRSIGSVPALDAIPDSPALPRSMDMPNSLSPSSARASPSKPLLLSSSSSGSDILLANAKAANQKDESFDHISLTDITEYSTASTASISKTDSKRPAPANNVISNANSNVSITVSSENDSSSSLPMTSSSEFVRRNSSKRRNKKGLSRESSQKSSKGSPAKSPARSPAKSLDRENTTMSKPSFDVFGSSSLTNSDSVVSTKADEIDANESVIENDNNYEMTGGLGNVMDMLSNW